MSGTKPESAGDRPRLTREELGIKEDAPDVFETADPPEAVPSAELAVQERELETARRAEKEGKPSQTQSIDRAPIQAEHARGVFKARDAVSLPAETDFSHAAHVRRTQEWRVLGYRQKPLETPQERYNRLKAEVMELEAEMVQAEKESSEAGKDASLLYPSQLKDQVDGLVERLEGLNAATTVSSSSATASLLARIDNLQISGAPPLEGGKGGGAGKGGDEAKVSAMEGRLARVEQVLGDGDLASLYPDVCSALDVLERKLALLQPGVIQQVASQVSKLEDRLKKGGDGGSGAAVTARLARLLETVERWDAVALLLPSVLARLKSLRGVHEGAASAVASLEEVQGRQEAVSKALKEQQKALEEARGTLRQNVEVMLNNLKTVEDRVQKLEAAKS